MNIVGVIWGSPFLLSHFQLHHVVPACGAQVCGASWGSATEYLKVLLFIVEGFCSFFFNGYFAYTEACDHWENLVWYCRGVGWKVGVSVSCVFGLLQVVGSDGKEGPP